MVQLQDADFILLIGRSKYEPFSGLQRRSFYSVSCAERYTSNILIQNVLCWEKNLALLGSTGPYWALLGSIWANIFTDALTLRMDKCLCKMGWWCWWYCCCCTLRLHLSQHKSIFGDILCNLQFYNIEQLDAAPVDHSPTLWASSHFNI